MPYSGAPVRDSAAAERLPRTAKTRIPWSSPALWKAVQDAFRSSLDQHSNRLGPARQHAAAIAHQLYLLSDWFDHLAETTCRVCSDPCCRHAKVWLGFQDLLFVHLHGAFLPPQQLRQDLREPCRYLGYEGCLLPRDSRPWICTWYVCPLQHQSLARDVPFGRTLIAAALARVKARREAMEAAFITALGFAAGPPDPIVLQKSPVTWKSSPPGSLCGRYGH